MRLILVRHGDPNYELDCLTELGHKQARIVAERLLEENIEKIFSSPMGRAQQTAQPFAELSGLKTIHTLDFMHEIRYGRADALYQSGNPWVCAIDLMQHGADLQDPCWRDLPEFAENVATIDIDNVMAGTDEWLSTLGYDREGLYYRCKTEDDRKRIFVLFSHGGSSTAFLSRVLNIPFPHLSMVLGHLPHTSISSLRFNREPGSLSMPILEYAVDVRHLPSY
jgi:probable phosphoglycerate mutase